jgi:hypothetical protein
VITIIRYILIYLISSVLLFAEGGRSVMGDLFYERCAAHPLKQVQLA